MAVKKRPPLPFKEIADQALLSIDMLLGRWLPGGETKGNEYKVTNPNRHDAHVGSFSIRVSGSNAGKWGDFATTDAGNDLISLYAYINGLENYQAGIEVADQIGFKLPDSVTKWRDQSNGPAPQKPVVDPAAVKTKKPKEPDYWHPIYPEPAPAEMEAAPLAHQFRGLPELKWEYKDATGQLLGYVYRFKTSDGGKETIPLVPCRHEKTGKLEWKWKQFADTGRPIYGLDRLAAKPDAWVLLVEGEKCADAPLELLKNAVIVSWPGGSNGVEKVDWSPLAGRNIYGWPDCDSQRERLTTAEKKEGIAKESKPYLPEHLQPGIKAMLMIGHKVKEINAATKFRMVDIDRPGIKPDGWDIYDAIHVDGFDSAALIEFIKRTRDYSPPPEDMAPAAETEKQRHTPKSAIAGEDEDAWRNSLVLTPKKDVADCRENVFVFLENHPDLKGLVAYDKFAARIVKTRQAPWDYSYEQDQPWEDNDNLELGLWLAQHEGLVIKGVDTLGNAVKLIASRNAYDPLIDYLESLNWDGVTRTTDWLTKYAGVEHNEYSALVGRFFLISMVARAYKPGCIMRAMPVFEGVQYRGKSSIARVLAGRWFSDSHLDLKGKDGFINIQGVWLNEIPELGSFNNQDSNIIKAYISSAKDRFRSPFDKYARDYPRRTVFFGTTNEDVYLRDKTGNTRFWPIRTERVGVIDFEALALVRDQLFAEAVQLYKSGERYHPSSEEQEKLFTPEQTLREYDDPWEEMIEKWLSLETFTTTSVSDVLTNCLKVEPSKITQAQSIQVGRILTRLGWRKSRPDADDGRRVRVYSRPDDQKIIPKEEGPDDDSIPF